MLYRRMKKYEPLALGGEKMKELQEKLNRMEEQQNEALFYVISKALDSEQFSVINTGIINQYAPIDRAGATLYADDKPIAFFSEEKHEYLMGVQQYFGGEYRFQIVAHCNDEALELGRDHIQNSSSRDNMIKDTLRVIRQLKPQFGGNCK